VHRTLRQVCKSLSWLAETLMRAVCTSAPANTYAVQRELEASKGVEAHNDPNNQKKKKRTCSSRALTQARLSPVSVQHAFGEVSLAQKLQCLPGMTLSFTHMYHNLSKHELWSTRFERGVTSEGATTVRSLATRHLGHPSTDGWNVIAGAVELACAWALRADDLPADTSVPFEFSMATRFRLAMCVSISWKFQRAVCSHFPRRFYNEFPNLIAPHTRELAYIGYAFLYEDEQAEFGGWSEANSHSIGELYDRMLALEVDLLTSVNVMMLLTRNAQVEAEERLQKMVDEAAVDGEAAMVLRSIIPLFRVASEDGKMRRPTAGALLCAAVLCLPERRELAARWFNDEDCELACELLRAAILVRGMPADTLAVGCFTDPAWINHKYIFVEALERALQVANGLVC
jgi:hypothetical protein